MIEVALRELVRKRAGDRCEYCRLLQEDSPFARFHIEHVIPKQHGGANDASNLALACNHCNLHKGPNLASLDPDSRKLVPLFNPRTQYWDDHFVLRNFHIVGRSASGKATVRILNMNAAAQIELRQSLKAEPTKRRKRRR